MLRPRLGQKEPPRLGRTICYGQTWARKSHQDSAVRVVTAKSWPERATKTRQSYLLRRKVNQKEPPRPASTIRYGQKWARKNHQDSAVRFVTAKRGPIVGQNDSAVRFVTAKSGPERGIKIRQYDLLRPRVGQKEPTRLGSTICYGQDLARKSHQDSAVRFVTAKSWPERATETRQYDLLRPRVGQKEPPGLGSTICYRQELARKSHQDSAVRFVTAKRGPERATKTRQYDLLRPNVGQKGPPRLGSTICYGQTWARKSHQDSAVRFVTAKSCPERATKARQYDLLRPNVGQKEPPRLGSTICYGQTWARKSHQDSAVRFVTAKSWPEKPPRLGSTICYGQTWVRKSHQDSAVRFVTAKRGPERTTKTRQYDLVRPTERATETRQYDLLRPTWARKSHQDSAVRCVTAKSWLERATKTRQYDLLRPRLGQKKPPRLGSTICYGQTWARKSHQDSAVRFVTAKSWPEKATKTRQYDLLRPRVGQKMPPRLGSTTCYGQTWARKSHQDSAVRFVTAKSWPEKATKTRQYDLLRPRRGPERATKARQYDLLRQELARKSHRDSWSTICYGQTWARKSHQDSAVRFVTAKRGPERATKTRQYDLLRPRVGQKKPPRLGSTICYGQHVAPEKATKTRQYDLLLPTERATETRQYDLLLPKVGQKEPPRLGSTTCYGQELARICHQDGQTWARRATKTRQYDLLRPRVGQKEPPRQCDLLRSRVGQKEPPRLGSTICYGQELARKMPPRLGSTICYGQTWARKSHQDLAVRFVTAKSWTEKATKTRQYDLLRPRVGQKMPPRLGSTTCYGQELARKSHQDSAVRFVTAKSWPEKATKTRQYDLLRPNVGQKEPPRLGSTICYGQTWARRATKTRQYDLLRLNVRQKEPPRLGSTICYDQTWASRLGSTICYGQELARTQDSAVRFVTAKSWPERATKTWQYDLLRPNVGLKEPPRLGSTICYGQRWARKSHQDSAVRFVTAKSWPERATKTRQYDLLRPNVRKPPRLGSTICYGQELARKSHQDSEVRFVAAKSWPEKATKTRQYDLLRPNVGQKEPPRLGSTICYGRSWPERATKTRQYDLLRPRVGQKEPPRLGSTICYGQELARKSHQDSAVRFVTDKRGPPRLGSTICHGQEWARKSHQDSAV